MFGYIIVNKPEMKFREFDVYHGQYCGLCRKLKEHYGKFGQITLSYDMVFVLMTLTSLYELETTKSMKRCVTHPLQKHEERVNNITDYVAHMNILLTYYKCKDDWNDDRKLKQLVLEKILYHKSGFSRNFYREKWKKISHLLDELSKEEEKDNQDIDQMSGMFGEMMAEIMLYQDDEWKELLSRFGFFLGKFIYLMDAYDDVEKDSKDGSYNPFKELYKQEGFEEKVRQYLELIMSCCCRAFEVLPIIDNAEIMRNILYAGVWAKYTRVTQERKKPETTGEGENKAAEKAAE